MKHIKSFRRMELSFAEDSVGASRARPDVVSAYRPIAQASLGCLFRNLFPCQCLGMAFCKLFGSDPGLSC